MLRPTDVLYQVVTDRFHTGGGDLTTLLNTPDYDHRLNAFCGGTFNGVLRHASYFRELGIDHVLISPVTDSDYYHGYHSRNDYSVNHRFGTPGDLLSMIRALQRQGIGVMLDYAATHTHIVNSTARSNPHWFHIPKGSAYYDELHYKLTSGSLSGTTSHRQREQFFFFDDPLLPLYNLTRTEVVKHHQQVLSHWLGTYGFENVRLDSAFLQPASFIEAISEHVHKHHPGTQVFAEYWSFEPAKLYECYGLCDGEFGIPITLTLNRMEEQFFSHIMAHAFRSSQKKTYRHIAQLDSHDTQRFSGSISDQVMASTIQFLMPWHPMIYYGNETGMRKMNQHIGFERSRDVMDFTSNPLQRHYQRLSVLRKIVQQQPTIPVHTQINDNGTLFTTTFQTQRQEFYLAMNRQREGVWVNTEHLFYNRGVVPFDHVHQRVIAQRDEYIYLEAQGTHLLSNK